jgi:hypothetical protein
MRALADYIRRQRGHYDEQRRARMQRDVRYLMWPIEDYQGLGIREQELRPGRQCVVRWERCRALALQRKRERRNNFRLTTDQVRLMNEMRNTMVLFWYGNNSDAINDDRHWLRETLGYTGPLNTFAARFPRRAGKTLVATLVAAITMASQVDGNCFAINPRVQQAQMFLEQVREHLCDWEDDEYFGWVEKKYSKSDNILQIAPKWQPNGGVTECVSRGGAASEHTVQNLRGGGKRIMALFIDENEFTSDAAPVVWVPMVRYGASVIATSSANANRSPAMTAFYEAVYGDGQRIVKLMDYRTKCAECLNRPRATSAIASDDRESDQCPHVLTPPTHLTRLRETERGKGLMDPFGDYDVELGNAPPGVRGTPVFSPDDINACLGLHVSALKVGTYEYAKTLYLALDPGTITEKSVTALVTFFMTPFIPDGAGPRGPKPRLHDQPSVNQYCVVRPLPSTQSR